MFKNSFMQAWTFLLAIFFIFLVTFVLFPGTTTDTKLMMFKNLEPEKRRAWQGLFFTFLFNVFDTVGRFMGGIPKFTLPDKVVIISSYARIIFILTFMLIAWAVSPKWLFGDSADWFKILNMILFAFSNGFISTQLAIKAPSQAREDSKE